MFLKKIILFTSALLLSNMLCAEKYQYFVNQATNQILTSPYQFFIYQPSSLIDKAIENLPAYSDVKKCASNNISDAILIIKPILFYKIIAL